METRIVPLSAEARNSPALQKRIKIRTMTAEEFIEHHGSGTLRKCARIGFAWKKQYLEERIAYEFGYEFRCLPRTRVTFNDPISEGDESAITETAWHIERYMTLSVFPEDAFEAKYLTVDIEGVRSEGVGMVVRTTSAPFIPDGNLVFSIITHCITGGWTPARNPF